MGFFSKDKNKYLHGFAKTNDSLGKKLRFVTENKKQNKEDFMEQLMVTLIEADIGYRTSEIICDRFFETCQNYYYLFAKDIMNFLGQTFKEVYYEKPDSEIVFNENGPTADTFRAGAVEQLKNWADRLELPCISGRENEDPSSVLVKGCRYAKDNNIDILICDTAGRLQNKLNLMAELEKMHRVLGKEIEGAPHNTWLVLDANTGQNGLSQAELFNEITDLNGVILTKMDGTSKGGIIIAIKHITGIPVRYITVGESMEDIQDFDFDMYLDSIIGELRHAS